LYDVNNDNIEVYEFNKKLRIVKKWGLYVWDKKRTN
jgi:hypothetical protein